MIKGERSIFSSADHLIVHASNNPFQLQKDILTAWLINDGSSTDLSCANGKEFSVAIFL